MVRGKVRVLKKRQKKNGKEYIVEQCVIYVRSDYIDVLRKYDNKEVEFVLFEENEERKRPKSDVTSDLLRTVYFLIFGKSSRKSNKEIIAELKQKLEELEKLL